MSFDNQSEGYAVGKSIIGDKPTAPATPKHSHRLPKIGDLHSIHIKPVANGVTVEHSPKDPKHGGSDYSKETSFAFNNMKDAHAHVGKLMGIGDQGEQ